MLNLLRWEFFFSIQRTLKKLICNKINCEKKNFTFTLAANFVFIIKPTMQRALKIISLIEKSKKKQQKNFFFVIFHCFTFLFYCYCSYFFLLLYVKFKLVSIVVVCTCFLLIFINQVEMRNQKRIREERKIFSKVVCSQPSTINCIFIYYG